MRYPVKSEAIQKELKGKSKKKKFPNKKINFVLTILFLNFSEGDSDSGDDSLISQLPSGLSSTRTSTSRTPDITPR